MWIRYNGTDWVYSTKVETIPARKSAGNPSSVTISAHYLGTSVNTGDYIELVWGGESTLLSLGANSVGSSPTRPAAPSVSLTIEQAPESRGTMMAMMAIFTTSGMILAAAVGGVTLVLSSWIGVILTFVILELISVAIFSDHVVLPRQLRQWGATAP